jgi:hypothetical protein
LLETRDLPSGLGVVPDYGQIPIAFEANQGQIDPQVKFLARGSGYSLFLTANESVLTLQQQSGKPTDGNPPASDILRIALVGANGNPQVFGLTQRAAISNYFIGNDPTQWHSNIPNYGQVEYQNVYDGINLIYYGNQRQLEYDFQLAAGADANAIRLAITGAQSISLDAQGDLVLTTPGGDVVEHAPVIYQESNGVRQPVDGHYVLEDNGQIGFAVGPYDPSKPLTIDPVLVYSTYLGGSGFDSGNGIAVDSTGDAYVIGTSNSNNFPATNAGFGPLGLDDVFVTKLNAAGTGIVYSTYLGGTNNDFAEGIAIDGSGNAYLCGGTDSTDFPTTAGSIEPTDPGGRNGWVAKLSADGTTLDYCTYIGGSNSDFCWAIAVDPNTGIASVLGDSTSTDFPVTSGAYQTTKRGGFDATVMKINAAGTAFFYATYLGGSADENLGVGGDIAIDSSGDAYVTGYTKSTNFPTKKAIQSTNHGGVDAFVTELNPTGTGLIFSTYLGGSVDALANSGNDYGRGIALDSSGNIYVTGYTTSIDFPTVNGIQATHANDGGLNDAFVAKIAAGGTSLLWSTYLGGTDDDKAYAIAVDGSGNAYITGQTLSIDFPTLNSFSSYSSGLSDAFVPKFNSNGSLAYSTYFGDNNNNYGYAIAVDSGGNAYVTGKTDASNFPTTSGAYQTIYGGGTDAFVTKLRIATLTMTNAFLVDSTDKPLAGPPAAGSQIYVEGDFNVSNLPSSASYHLSFTVDGVPINSPNVTYGAGLAGTYSYFYYLGMGTVTAGTHTVTVTVDPNRKVAGADESGKSFTYVFTTIPFSDSFDRSTGLGNSWRIPPLPGKYLFAWRRRLGNQGFQVQNNTAVSQGTGGLAADQVAGFAVQDITLQADVDTSNSSTVAVGLFARLQSNGAAYAAVLTQAGKAEIWLINTLANTYTVLDTMPAPGGVTAANLKFVLSGSTLSLYVNNGGTPLVTANDPAPLAGGVGLFAWGPNGIIDNFSLQ